MSKITVNLEKILNSAWEEYLLGGSNRKMEFEEYLLSNPVGKQFSAQIANLVAKSKKTVPKTEVNNRNRSADLNEMIKRIIKEESANDEPELIKSLRSVPKSGKTIQCPKTNEHLSIDFNLAQDIIKLWMQVEEKPSMRTAVENASLRQLVKFAEKMFNRRYTI